MEMSTPVSYYLKFHAYSGGYVIGQFAEDTNLREIAIKRYWVIEFGHDKQKGNVSAIARIPLREIALSKYLCGID